MRGERVATMSSAGRILCIGCNALDVEEERENSTSFSSEIQIKIQ